MLRPLPFTLTAALIAIGPLLAAIQPAAAATTAARQTVTRADQLPRRAHVLPQLPSALLTAPLADLQALGAQVEALLAADLAAYDIQDNATLRDLYGAMASLAQLRGDWSAVPGWTAKARALQDKPGARLASGVLTDLLTQQRQEQRHASWLQAEVARRFGAMPWADVQDIVKSNKGSIETYNPELVRGAVQAQLDAVARNGGLSVPESLLLSIISARMQIELLAPSRQAVVQGLQRVVEANTRTAAMADVWTPRTFAIAPDAKASPVVVGVWDSGVDLALFKAAAGRGIAFGDGGQPAADLLRPLGTAEPRWPQLRGLVKGAMDQRAALDTPDAQQFRATLAALKADDVRGFSEDMALAGMYVHGTHVAGIAVDGNPFAQVYAATMLWSHLSTPSKPGEARSRAWAAAYQATVDGFKAAGVRVVNMSWRYGPAAIEGMLAFHNLGGTPEARKQEALRLFAIERDALREAMASAPGILFVAGAGNEDNSADFQEYIPAGLSLPNLITVGAVDRAGQETSFSTFGKTVVVHANGFEVDSPVPGGVRMKLSGTSMASPQVANLAAKLLALQPALTPVQLKALILDGAERLPGADGQPGRVNLLHPRRSAQLAGLKIE